MLKRRIIPKLQIAHSKVGVRERPILVTTRQFSRPIRVGDPVSQAKIYEAQLADELIVPHIDSRPIARDQLMLQLIERLASETFMPLTVGGGVHGVNDFATLLGRGADKVCLNSAALQSPTILSRAAERFGTQCVVVSIDCRKDEAGVMRPVYDRGQRYSELEVLDWAAQAVQFGAGEILLTDVDRDGSGDGLNCDLCRAVAEAVNVPVIISGGCGRAQHFVQAFVDGGASAVSAGTYFCFRDQNPMQARAHVSNAGVPIRMGT